MNLQNNNLTGFIANSYRGELNRTLADFKKYQIHNFKKLLDTVCRSLQIIPEIKFLGSEIEEINELRYRYSKLNDTYSNRYRCNFEIKYKDEVFPTSFYFDFPILVDDEYFVIDGNQYIPILQLVNFLPVHIDNSSGYKIIIKTLINKLILTVTKPSISENTGRYSSGNITVNLFMKNINLILLLLAILNFNEKDSQLIEENKSNPITRLLDSFFDDYKIVDSSSRGQTNIDLGTKKVIVLDKDLETSSYKQIVIDSFKHNRGLSYDKCNDRRYILKQLGKRFTTNESRFYEKSESVLLTLSRILDDISISNFGQDNIYDLMVNEVKLIDDEERLNYNIITNRKLVFNEVFIFPLVKRLSDNLYMYINSNHKSLNKLKNIFKIPSQIIFEYLLSSEVIHYNNSVNNLSVLLKYKTSLAPTNSGTASSDVKNVNKEYIGIIDLFSTSNSKKTAGVSGYLTPLNGKYIFDTDGFVLPNSTVKLEAIEGGNNNA